MTKTYKYIPQNVCSRAMEITYEDGIIVDAKIIGGCPGNTQGLTKLVKGRKIDEVNELLKGIKCPGSKSRNTSCPDQLACALQNILDNNID